MEDIKQIRLDFHLVTWVMAQGGTWGYRWGLGSIFFEIQPDLECELLTSMTHATAQFLAPSPWGLREGPKGQISLNLNHKVKFIDFRPNFLCLLVGFSFGRLGHAPGVGLGVPWDGWGSKKWFSRNSTRSDV